VIHHAIPADLQPLENSSIGASSPGVDVTTYQTGPKTSRQWQDLILRTYSWTLALFKSSSDYLEQWERFLWLVGINANPVWIIEPISGRHNGVQCGGISVASQTTFPLPVQSATEVSVFVADALQASSGYTVHSAANILGDAYAAGAVGTVNIWTPTGASIDHVCEDVFASLASSVEITPSAAATCSFVANNGATVVPNQDYTATVAIRGTHDCKVTLEWVGDSTIKTTTAVTATTNAWQQVTVSGTCPAGVTSAKIGVEIVNPSDTTPIYFDCFSLCPGDLSDWYLPSQSPAIIEFASATGADNRVTAHATGYRMARCRLSKPTHSWSISSQGHAAPQKWTATEEVWI